MSALGLMHALAKAGIRSCAVCADFGIEPVRSQIEQATDGEVLYLPLYWWTKRIRVDLWKRPIIEAREILRTGWARGSALRVARFAKRTQAQLVHTSTISTPEGGIAARLLGLPHVWHIREMIGPGHPFRLPIEGRSLGKVLSRRASHLIANSHATAACVREWLPEGLLRVVPNGIDLSRYLELDPRPAGGPIVVAMVGSLSARMKKHALFAEAAARIAQTRPIQFRVYGDLPDDDYADQVRRRVRELGLENRLTFAGFVPDPVQLMSEIDVLVQASNHESFGRVLVEAMAAGRPVVANRGGGSNEIVADGVTGFLAQEDDPAHLATLIERLADDAELRARLGRAGRERATSHFSLEASASGVLETYQASMSKPLSLWG